MGDAMNEQPESTNTTWTVWRMDEAGNRFVVRDRLTCEAADRFQYLLPRRLVGMNDRLWPSSRFAAVPQSLRSWR